MDIDTSIRSPNHAPRAGRPITMIVLHATVGSARSALAWLTNPAARVSAHYLIDKAGQIYQLVPDDLIAWHAGRAAWRNETAVNETSLGIELENRNSGDDPYPPVQLDALLALTRDRVARYQIAPENVVRHLDIALPRGRKSDPAGFPWAEFRERLFANLPPPPAERPPRPRHAPNEAATALGRAVFAEAYRQAGASEWPGWALGRAARTAALGLPVGPATEIASGGRSYLAQPFGRDTLISPLGEWRRVERLSALGEAGKEPLRDAVIDGLLAQGGQQGQLHATLRQVASSGELGPPLGLSFAVRADGVDYIALCFALDVLVARADGKQEARRLSALTPGEELAQALTQRWFTRVGSRSRPGWPLQQKALREQLGAPLGPCFRVSAGGRDYAAEAFALDALCCEIGRWEQITRLSTMLAPDGGD